MTTRFADAFYYLAMVNPRDQAHHRVKAQADSLFGPVVTTAWVLTEVGDALSSPPLRPIFHDLINELWADEETEIIPASDSLFRRGIALFNQRTDKSWSLTDCISFVVMTDRGLTDALTGDHHFEQAGFRALLRET
jgi:uncharacterized protein